MSDDRRRFSLFDDQPPDRPGGTDAAGPGPDAADAPTEWDVALPTAADAPPAQPPGPPVPPAVPEDGPAARPMRPAPWPASWEELPPPPAGRSPGGLSSGSGSVPPGRYGLGGSGPDEQSPPSSPYAPGAGYPPTASGRPGTPYPPAPGSYPPGAAPYPPGSYPPDGGRSGAAYPPDDQRYPAGAAAFPPPPPPPFDPYAPRPPVARGVTFKRPQEPQRRGLAVPLAGLVLVLVGIGIGAWLLGFIGGPDKSSRSPTPKPTLAGVIGSPSPSGSGSGSASPSTSPSGSPSESPTFTEEPTPTESPTESPAPTPTESVTPSPSPTRTPPPPTPPPTAPPDIPTPQPIPAPPGFPAGPGESILKVDFGDADFTGGHETTYHGRSARFVTGQATNGNTMTVRFWVTGDPRRTARLRINGLDSEESGKESIRIRINGTAIFTGPDPLANDVCCGSGGPGRWTSAAFDFESSLLQPGENRLTITDLEPGGAATGPFMMLDDARLLYRIKS
jgi:hypothetical protein